MKWEAVFFDFDGVILDSVDVKTQAFAAMFRSYGPDVEKAVVEYHLAHGGISRFKKFKYFYEHILNLPLPQDVLEKLGSKFNQMALEGVLSAPFIEGALETLKMLKDNEIPAFVISGTPQEEVQLIVEKRNLSAYFIEVHGSPRTKQDIIHDIASRHDFDLSCCLFIGDASTDFMAAQLCGTDFLGIVKNTKKSPFPESTRISEHVSIFS